MSPTLYGQAPDEAEGLVSRDARHERRCTEEERDFSASRSVFAKNTRTAEEEIGQT